MRGKRRRITRTAEKPGHVRSLQAHEIHVRWTCSHVFCRGVTPIQRLNETSVRTKERLAIRRLVVADDDRFSAAEWQSRKGRLVCHATRETQSVSERLVVGVVIPKPCASDGGTKRGAVNGDDAAIATLGIMRE